MQGWRMMFDEMNGVTAGVLPYQGQSEMYKYTMNLVMSSLCSLSTAKFWVATISFGDMRFGTHPSIPHRSI